jgi:hypothetical protein
MTSYSAWYTHLKDELKMVKKKKKDKAIPVTGRGGP